MNRRWLVFAAVAVAIAQIAFLISMIAGRATVLREGQEVMLSVEPVDPRDLLRGDYVTLTYNISRLPLSLFAQMPQESLGKVTVFVRLKADEDDIFQPVAAYYGEKPDIAPLAGEVDIRGEARLHWGTGGETVFVSYGIERFYVPEGEGREIEQGLGERSFRMKVAVGAEGTAQIKSLHDGETMLYAEPLY